MAPERPRVLILGGGFGGLAAAKALKGAPVDVTLVDRTNHHLFQPLLYQVATAGLAAPSIAAPIRHILRGQRNVTVLMGEAVDIDLAARTVTLAEGGVLGFDHLVVATGATHSYFGRDDWATHAPGLKTLADAQGIRARLLEAFEHAERSADTAERAALLRFVVIGGGPTGVEMAGTLAEIARHTLPGEFRGIDPASAEILLLEGGARILTAYPEALSASAKRQLESLGVRVRLGAKVVGIDADGVDVECEGVRERLPTRNVVWGAGVKASPLGALLAKAAGIDPDRAGRVPVQADLSLPRHPEVQVIGDLAALSIDGQPVPGIAPAAKQMGQHAARNVIVRLRGQATTPFRYRDYGSMATIGRHRAIGVIGGMRFTGLLAWWLWLFAHIVFLIGYRNRLVVLMDWASQYWTMQRHARVFSPRDDGT
ncbi:NAD(P)/FAD-dependent oxidoreductase [Silanimonas sp.]|jgi:NADH dehydrogenase|uniref:NAD(P)/FAD-dependent oxidoreductase n=1 Tax=Silanimonas sp. TaxID=1929290 RepID=UPI0022C0C56D|nr:NAD(P)/FAD-dependent oxidoreductase [Silanimonas sp.]MCZ8114289.1 NAD(P)/FAD-dependent oxidoreductase [Silanimonas sp.]